MKSDQKNLLIPLHKSPDLVCSFRVDHTFLSINFAFELISKYTEDTLRDISFDSLVHPQDQEYVVNQIKKSQENSSAIYATFRLKNRDGEYNWFHFCFFHDDNSKIIWAMGRGEASIEIGEKIKRSASPKVKQELAYTFPGIISGSSAFEHVLNQIVQIAPLEVTTILYGESGTGKGVVADAIHERSKRVDGPLVKIDCATLPEQLIESELFGYEKGAFTGATTSKIGKFEQANGGTIFLDEIREIPLGLQSKLLRVIQDKEFMRLGGLETIHVDVRIIAATNRDLKEAIRLGTFREDLYYRLHVFPIYIPPLRQRLLDIPLLLQHFLQFYAQKHQLPKITLAPACIYFLLNHAWPGNVRELKNLMERVIVQQQSDTSKILDLLDLDTSNPIFYPSESTRLEEMERKHILKVMLASGWKIEGLQGAALLLGLPPSTLRDKMKKLNIERPN